MCLRVTSALLQSHRSILREAIFLDKCSPQKGRMIKTGGRGRNPSPLKENEEPALCPIYNQASLLHVYKRRGKMITVSNFSSGRLVEISNGGKKKYHCSLLFLFSGKAYFAHGIACVVLLNPSTELLKIRILCLMVWIFACM